MIYIMITRCVTSLWLFEQERTKVDLIKHVPTQDLYFNKVQWNKETIVLKIRRKSVIIDSRNSTESALTDPSAMPNWFSLKKYEILVRTSNLPLFIMILSLLNKNNILMEESWIRIRYFSSFYNWLKQKRYCFKYSRCIINK